MEKIEKYDKYKFRIVSLESIKKDKNEISTLKKCNQDLANSNGKTLVAKDKEIEDLKQEIKIIRKDRLDVAAKYDTAKIDIAELTRKINSQKGGYKKEINKLRQDLDAKNNIISEYKRTIEELEKKNECQAKKIRELSNNIPHSVDEYRNDGLPKHTKRILIRRVKEK